MLTILAYVALALIAACAIILLLALRQPDHFQFARSTRIAASREKVHGLIDDLRAMNSWNPFDLRATKPGRYSEKTKGPGASYAFDCPKAGSGSIEIVSSTADQIALALHMTKPFKADNRVTFDLAEVDGKTEVTWGIAGPSPLIGKIISMFMSCEKMMSRDFEEGLANLKAMAERQ
ncbi:MAG: SRPBCC family protein [Hyphomicrobiaceae bacterium]|nr:SRPBCC family protein [Hyphomicrobiaceae bacterium]